MRGRKDFEHTHDLQEARTALAKLRRHQRKLAWFAGGYRNMGLRQLDQLRAKLEEAQFWLDEATRHLNEGAKRRQVEQAREAAGDPPVDAR